MIEPVTICIPAYQAAGFIDQTIDSVLGQTWPGLEIVISVDAGTDDTPRLARYYADLSCARVFVQPQRLGWIGNTNFLLNQARTRYVMIMPHDDLLEREYVERCMDALREDRDAAVAYSDLGVLNSSSLIAESAVSGPVEQRLAEILETHFAAVAFRGVFDRDKVRKALIPAAVAGFSADLLWVALLACHGNLVRVPERLYEKRYLPQSAHAGWYRATPSEQYEMWAIHCLEMLATIRDALPEQPWTAELDRAWRKRFERTRPPGAVIDEQLKTDGAALLRHLQAVDRRVRTRAVPYSWCDPQ